MKKLLLLSVLFLVGCTRSQDDCDKGEVVAHVDVFKICYDKISYFYEISRNCRYVYDGEDEQKCRDEYMKLFEEELLKINDETAF